ncbi:diguanylate cyclase [Massilia dura]|uniref:diguanylate cyclase n=1 Tax=Pseudoduganella dura TaxID=321982 RepID=A0A6I3XER5_9BURK|nr:diguanylate cyclase [Pseudoduganella dura]MUI13000.1 diguanylate cyclase [Pseudoduganella dura]GGX88000.1 sensor histidine kinase [Pseudoduganella dura]
MPAEARVRHIAIVAVVVSAVVAAIPFFINNRVSEGVPQLKIAADRQTAYTDLLGMLRDVESGQRGFALSGMDAFLDPYTAAVLEIPSLKRELLKGALDDNEREAIRQINELTDAKLSNAADSIFARRNHGATPESLYASTALGKAQMDKLRALIGKQITLMAERRNLARKTLVDGSAQVAYYSAFAGLFNALLLGTAVLSVRRLLKDRALAADKLKEAVVLAETRNSMMSGSARLLQALDSVQTLNDTSAVLTPCLTALLPNVSGTVYLYRDSQEVLEPLANFGHDEADSVISSEDCWALRFGRAHDHHIDTDLCCHHLLSEPRKHHLCIPMVTQGAVLGLMSVKVDQLEDKNFELHRELVNVLAEQVSLALSNVRLREALREQSIIDPLTDLYNRRFLEESLKRELARSVRNQASLSVIMFDVDHFKRLNDTFGHDAGDVVLKAVATATKAAVRKADIVCRYGGEEMIVVMPDCSEGMAMERAEMIRQAIEAVRIEHDGRDIPPVTASFGVASHPVFGLDGDALVRAADAALYVAKRRGRNNVQMAA